MPLVEAVGHGPDEPGKPHRRGISFPKTLGHEVRAALNTQSCWRTSFSGVQGRVGGDLDQHEDGRVRQGADHDHL